MIMKIKETKAFVLSNILSSFFYSCPLGITKKSLLRGNERKEYSTLQIDIQRITGNIMPQIYNFVVVLKQGKHFWL